MKWLKGQVNLQGALIGVSDIVAEFFGYLPLDDLIERRFELIFLDPAAWQIPVAKAILQNQELAVPFEEYFHGYEVGVFIVHRMLLRILLPLRNSGSMSALRGNASRLREYRTFPYTL